MHTSLIQRLVTRRRHLAGAFVLGICIALVVWPPAVHLARASTPSSGSVSDGSASVSWSGSTLASNPVFNRSTCQTAQNCDRFDLTINVSSAYRSANPTFVVFVRIDWQNAANDYDLFIFKDGAAVDDSAQGFTTFEEVMLRQPANGVYQVFAHSFATVPGTPYTGKATLLPAPPAVVFRSATYQKDPDGKFGPQMFQFTSDLRLIGANQGQTGQNVEPEIEVNPFGTIYASAIQGVPAGTDAWRSRDGGASFQYLGQPDGTQRAQAGARGAGGGDTDISLGAPFVLLDVPGVGKVDSTGRLYVSSLWLGSSTVSSSINEGDLFAVSELPIPIHDRQWNASAGVSRLYVTARQLGALLVGTTSLFVVQSDDGGLTYPRGAFITLLFTTEEKERLQGNIEAHPGPVTSDPPNTTIYNVYSGRLRTELFVARCPAPCNLPLLLANGQIEASKKSFIIRRIFSAPPGLTVDNVFPVIAPDKAGGVHVAFSDKKDVFLMSSRDGGETWNDPVRVNNPADADLGTNLFPWIYAGDAGRVGIMWYGTDRVGNSDSETQFSGAQWKVYHAFTADAFAAAPTFQYVAASGMASGTDLQRAGIVHVGSICTQGLNCNLSTPPGNRNLAEYSSNSPDNEGLANIVYAGDVNTPNGRARTHFTKQVGGPTALLRPIVTGGGTIPGERSFGFNVQGDLSGPWVGSVNYLDKAGHLHLKGDRITSVSVSGNRVTFSGSGTLTTAAGTSSVTFTIVATDVGEPGAGNDAFSISISTGYSAGGTLTGGNIQKH